MSTSGGSANAAVEKQRAARNGVVLQDAQEVLTLAVYNHMNWGRHEVHTGP